jgi:hypothetical protein
VEYSATLVDHFRNPRNAGMMREPDGVGEGEELAQIGEARIEDAVGGLPAERRHVAAVVALALQAAARDALARRTGD